MSFLAELIGDVLDNKYRIERLLGQGGMGAVYLATHIGTTRPVALKIIAPQFMEFEEFVVRFQREAEAAGRLLHPNIVNVTDFGFAGIRQKRVAYLVMEYLDGSTLGDMLEKYRRLPLRVVVDIFDQICLAIDAAHQQEIIHRDLKPDNIWLQPDGRGGYTVKVLDFGLAKLRYTQLPEQLGAAVKGSSSTAPSIIDINEAKTAIKAAGIVDDTPTQILSSKEEMLTPSSAAELTRVGTILGTPLYMSPEQCAGESLDARSDIYSLAVIVYQMLSGGPPFRGNLDQLISQHCNEAPPSLAEKQPDIPKAVALLVDSALAKSPAARPASAAAFASAFRANSDGAGTLFQQALALYSEHFKIFIKISLIAYLPFILIIIANIINDLLAAFAILPATISENIAYLMRMLLIICGQIALAINGGIFVPVVAQLQIAPLRPLSSSAMFAELKKRTRALAITTILFNLAIGPLLLFFLLMIYRVWLEPGRLFLLMPLFCLLAFVGIKITLDYLLYPSVVILEEQQGMAALARAKALGKRVQRSLITIYLPLLLIAIFNLFLIFGLLAGSDLRIEILIGSQPISGNFHIYDTALTLFITLVGIIANPLFSIFLAMLYLKSRQSGGDTFKAVLGKFL